MKSETQNIIDRYEKRKNDHRVIKNDRKYTHYMNYMRVERESAYKDIIINHFEKLHDLKLLEIGAGTGDNLYLFNSLGMKPKNVVANELLPDRLEILRERFPDNKVWEGNALEISNGEDELFDIVFQGTVFTSILDFSFKVELANKIWSLLKPGGIVLWYDFAYDNPRNKDVKGIKRKEIIRLFPEHNKINFRRVTIAPPIGRRIGRLYPLFNLFPFFRSHLIAEIHK